jgi:hypothetical protein
VDIQQIMQLLQARGMGQGGMAQAPNPLGALQPGMGPGPGAQPPVAQPDFNAILYRQMMQEQQDRMRQMMQQRAAQGTLGAGGLAPGNAPMGFGAQPPQAAPPPQMTQPAGEAMLPGGGMAGALGMGGQPGLMQQRRNVAPY